MPSHHHNSLHRRGWGTHSPSGQFGSAGRLAGWICQTTVVALDLAARMAALDDGDSSTYSIAWIDCIPKGAQLGRSLVFLGEQRNSARAAGPFGGEPVPSLGHPKLSTPIDFPA